MTVCQHLAVRCVILLLCLLVTGSQGSRAGQDCAIVASEVGSRLRKAGYHPVAYGVTVWRTGVKQRHIVTVWAPNPKTGILWFYDEAGAASLGVREGCSDRALRLAFSNLVSKFGMKLDKLEILW